MKRKQTFEAMRLGDLRIRVSEFKVDISKIITYMPLSEKQRRIEVLTKDIIKHFDGMDIAPTGEDAFNFGLAHIDPFIKEISCALVHTIYFGLDVGPEFGFKEYDTLHEGGYFKKIAIAKNLADTENKASKVAWAVREALADYNLFTKLLNSTLNNEVNRRNELRLQMTPQHLDAINSKFAELNQELTDYKDERQVIQGADISTPEGREAINCFARGALGNEAVADIPFKRTENKP